MTDIQSFERGRANRDQALFNRMAEKYARKDTLAGMRIARKHRAIATWTAMGQIRVPRILEMGCGAGFSARYLQGHFVSYLGLDYSGELIRLAEDLNGGPSIQFQEGDATGFLPVDPPDAVLLIGVLHHLDDPLAALKHCYRILKPGGHVLANEPQNSNRLIGFVRNVRRRVDGDYSDEQVFFQPGELAGLASSAGFENPQTRGQGLLTTPFAEVALPGQGLLAPIVHAFSFVDAFLEKEAAPLMKRLAWNVVLVAEKPSAPRTDRKSP